MAAEGVINPRQTLWDGIRQLAGAEREQLIDAAALVDLAAVNRKTARDYLHCLVVGGYLESVGLPAGRFRLVKDAGVHAPRLRPDGSAVTQGAGVQNLWRSMRMLAKFTALDLALHSTTEHVQVAEATAQSYCSMLLATGYLRVVQKADPARGRKAIYRLIRNDGPKPPMIQRVKQVFDPNTGRIYRKGGAE